MAAISKIEWTERTWNPIAGCSRISPGCTNCYAEKMGKRLRAMAMADQEAGKNPGRKEAYIEAIKPAGGWSGKLVTIPDALNDPFGWKKPQRIFVNSMSDLFHADVPVEFIDQVFAVMWDCHWHTFQVLTKRADRMRKYFEDDPIPRIAAWSFKQWSPDKAAQGLLGNRDIADEMAAAWPIPNVWLGVSVENQAMADKRIPDLLETSSAVRFLSCEPLLGPIYLDAAYIPGIDWAIIGGESGPHARPMHPDWARSLRDQCQAANVPFFFKQWGEWSPLGGEPSSIEMSSSKITAVYVHHNGSSAGMVRNGKKLAGRILDGRTWDEFPAIP